MSQRLMGLEMECGFAVIRADGSHEDHGPMLQRFAHVLGRLEPHLPGRYSSGCFLQNGGRFYLDCGHPEITTPECTTPEEVVRYKLAAEAILVRAATALNEELAPKARVVLFGNNFDYLTQNTWGCHESYLYRASSAQLAEHLIPHLASRIVFTGVGGFDPGWKHRFLLSPRVAWLTGEVSGNSTQSRGIWHTRDESLSASGYKRAHVLCGENNRSQLATYLKVGTTALVILLVERGARPGDVVGLPSALQAMRGFSRDPSCTARAATVSGRCLTAIEIQRHYLDLAKAALGRPYMPGWAATVCARWEHTLENLAQDPVRLHSRLDWPLKLQLLRQWAANRGWDWDRLQRDGLEKEAHPAGAEMAAHHGGPGCQPDAAGPTAAEACSPPRTGAIRPSAAEARADALVVQELFAWL